MPVNNYFAWSGVDMWVYVVFREAVYRHECAGVFRTLAAAKAVARACLGAESDNHHNYAVHRFRLDVKPTTTAQEPNSWGLPFEDEDKPLAIYRRESSGEITEAEYGD